ncbi:hypothetical protein Salat_1893200 [Sesamum alatum]|uniref:Retroviral polymerase SH3-like domain-containing protein n=1 Tax=Sesamum alatum TaxID=300844 RepID=A0AAE1Y4N2_9LAMI|nr:hypothetical protein Salat_1893200 [Sesamum alatum]
MRNKLEPRALRFVYVGYSLYQKGYRCYHPPPHSRKLYVTMDVDFHKDTMYYHALMSPRQGENKIELLNLNNSFDTLKFINISGGRNLDLDVDIRNEADQMLEDQSSQGYVENADVQNFQEHVEVASQENPHLHDVPFN